MGRLLLPHTDHVRGRCAHTRCTFHTHLLVESSVLAQKNHLPLLKSHPPAFNMLLYSFLARRFSSRFCCRS